MYREPGFRELSMMKGYIHNSSKTWSIGWLWTQLAVQCDKPGARRGILDAGTATRADSASWPSTGRGTDVRNQRLLSCSWRGSWARTELPEQPVCTGISLVGLYIGMVPALPMQWLFCVMLRSDNCVTGKFSGCYSCHIYKNANCDGHWHELKVL